MDFNDMVDTIKDAIMSTTPASEEQAQNGAYMIVNYLDTHGYIIDFK